MTTVQYPSFGNEAATLAAKPSPARFARSIHASGRQDELVRTVRFGASGKSGESPLPSVEEVPSTQELLGQTNPDTLGPGLGWAMEHAKMAGSSQLEFEPFVYGLVSHVQRCMDRLMYEKHRIDQVPGGINHPNIPAGVLRDVKYFESVINDFLPPEVTAKNLKHDEILKILSHEVNGKWVPELKEKVSASNGGSKDYTGKNALSEGARKLKIKFSNFFTQPKSWTAFNNPITMGIVGTLMGIWFPPLLAITVPATLLWGVLKAPDHHVGPRRIPITNGDEAPVTKIPTGNDPDTPPELEAALARFLAGYVKHHPNPEDQTLKSVFQFLRHIEDQPGVPDEINRTAARIHEIHNNILYAIRNGKAAEKTEKYSAEYYLEKLAARYNPENPEQANQFTKAQYESTMDLIERLKRSDGPNRSIIEDQLEWRFKLPTEKRELKEFDPDQARTILDEDHYDLEKVKNRIIRHLGARDHTKDLEIDPKLKKPTILCLVGPPGVGKTSIGKSIARATGRDFATADLGGVSDESEIRGHRKAYIGSEPGKIIKALVEAGSTNPVFMLDEIDKLGKDFKGDPAAALMGVLDPSKNREFEDHFMGMPVDLSDVLFVCTANYPEQIPPALRDRMEMIVLPGYTPYDKYEIADRHFVPKTRERHGLSRAQLESKGLIKPGDQSLPQEPFTIPRNVQEYLVTEGYSPGLGVRSLETVIDSIGEQFASNLAGIKRKGGKLTAKDFAILNSPEELKNQGYIEDPPYPVKRVSPEPRIGQSNGLYYSEGPRSGGALDITVDPIPLKNGQPGISQGTVNVEVNDDVKDQLEKDGGSIKKGDITGNIQGSMQESITVAINYVEKNWSRIEPFLLPEYKNKPLKLNFHIKDLAVPKDGPSAGAILTLTLISALTGAPIPGNFAMTGAMHVRGDVLRIGGVREKIIGSYMEGVRDYLVPEENSSDIKELPDAIKNDIGLKAVSHINEVYRHLWNKSHPDLVAALTGQLPAGKPARRQAPKFSGGVNPFSQVAAS